MSSGNQDQRKEIITIVDQIFSTLFPYYLAIFTVDIEFQKKLVQVGHLTSYDSEWPKRLECLARKILATAAASSSGDS